jgi:hypothetical protein
MSLAAIVKSRGSDRPVIQVAAIGEEKGEHRRIS